jgi:hypothetical protein
MSSVHPVEWALILGVITTTIIGVLMCILCTHKATASSNVFRMKVAKLKEELATKMNSPTFSQDELDKIKKKIQEAQESHGIWDDFSQSIMDPITNHPVVEKIDNLMWHTAMGRISAAALNEVIGSVDTVMNMALAFFLNSLVGVMINTYMAGNIVNGWTTAVAVLLILKALFGIVRFHAAQYMQTRLGGAFTIYDLPVKND